MPLVQERMGELVKVEQKTAEPVLNIVLDTLSKNKQAFVFVNTKRSAEKTAEEIAKKIKEESSQAVELSEQLLRALPKHTQQCERLAKCARKGIVFHHAGLHAKQKELIEDSFRKGIARIICCTPTLAAGVDLPAFRTIIRDVKRFSGHGMQYIPVLEFLQMAGRAGRPSFDSFGEAILVASTEGERDALFEKYVKGLPEDIYSKLAVEPVLRTYVLSLIASQVVRSEEQVKDFFARTFWAHQFKDLKKLNNIVDKMLELLEEWGFIQKIGDAYRATVLGRRVAELYIDPLTAHQFVLCTDHTAGIRTTAFSWLHAVSSTLEMRPYVRVRTKEYDEVQELLAKHESSLLLKEPSMFEPEFDEFLHGFKTALVLQDWIEEKDEEYLLEHYDIRPGETRAKINTGNWLLYALVEIARIRQKMSLIKEISRVRYRLRYGVKEELLPLLRLEGIGRVRARLLFRNGVKDLGGVRTVQAGLLENLLGKKIALSIKKQVGGELPEPGELGAPLPNSFAEWEN
jgi:helicase